VRVRWIEQHTLVCTELYPVPPVPNREFIARVKRLLNGFVLVFRIIVNWWFFPLVNLFSPEHLDDRYWLVDGQEQRISIADLKRPTNPMKLLSSSQSCQWVRIGLNAEVLCEQFVAIFCGLKRSWSSHLFVHNQLANCQKKWKMIIK
jgi:hypothetical protein